MFLCCTLQHSGTNGGGGEGWPTTGELISAGYAVSATVKRRDYGEEKDEETDADRHDSLNVDRR